LTATLVSPAAFAPIRNDQIAQSISFGRLFHARLDAFLKRRANAASPDSQRIGPNPQPFSHDSSQLDLRSSFLLIVLKNQVAVVA
jgi:hypothetical protein